MEIPDLKDFKRLEEKIDELTLILRTFIGDRANFSEPKSMVLSVKDVEDEFKQSPHTQRNARKKGQLKFIPSGRDIHYSHNDVEQWMQSKIIG